MFLRLFLTNLCIVFLATQTCAALLYTSPAFNPENARLVVVIHGCLQSAESMALGTGWNQIADKNNLVILYPQVPEGSNLIGCWSWYLSENQKAESGQLRTVRNEIEKVKNLLQLKNPKTYLVGISSGAATVAGLMACFPNDFIAAGLHSGPSYGLAQNLLDGDKVLKEGPPAKKPDAPCKVNDYNGSTIVIQGSADTKVNPKNAEQIINDFASNAKALPPRDLHDRETRYRITDYAEMSSIKLRYVEIQEFGHAWAGFVKNLRFGALLGPDSKSPTQIPFFSAVGPSATNLMWEFFSQAK